VDAEFLRGEARIENPMNAVRLRQIEEIYQIAADSAPDHRAALVDSKCGGDEVLRREVESLLSFDEISDSFIDNSPDAIAAEMFADEEVSSPLIGKTIGHYKIQRLLGEGGMGEVYLADDAHLNRKVALKILPSGIVEQQDRLKRFKQEAIAVSALNHPNILTIHEFGTEGQTNFIVTEFVDGVTLREKMKRGRFSVNESLQVAEQIASALAGAHAAGIVHRDIKPENVMIRRDGIAKVLDFGLAKLSIPDTGTEAQTLFKTEPGMIMGTASYMSPEQARGLPVDGRTDIWSLGVIMYEMLTAHTPFSGPTHTDVLVAILNQPIPMIEIYVDDAPLELRRIIDKALAKNAADRYLTIEELAEDLKRFHRRLEFEAELGRSNDGIRPNSQPTTRFNEVTRALPVVSNEQLTQQSPQVSQKRRLLVPAVVIAIALAAVIGLLVWQSGMSNTAVVPEPPVVPVTAAPVQMVAYSLTVQGFTDGRYKEPFKLSGEMLFRNKDRIRLHIVSPNAGYLYILNQGPRGENDEPAFNILFPSPTTNNGSASISAGREIQVPGQSWFELDEKEGTEFVWLVWSKNAIPELESAKRFANPQDRGRIKDIELSRTIGSILQEYQTDSSNIERDDDKKQSIVKGNTDIIAHNIKLEHH
jgi:serine/threonine protein kinase